MGYFTFVGMSYDPEKNCWNEVQLKTGASYSYGDFEQTKNITDIPKNKLFILPRDLSGSDYSNGIVTTSNHRVFLKMFQEVEGVYDLYGGMGTYAIAIRADVSEEHPEIKKTLDALEDYPLIDEEDHSRLEQEWQEEAMKDLLKDVIRALERVENSEELEKAIENENTIEGLIWEGIGECGLVWSYENTSTYLNPDKIVPYVHERLLLDHSKKLPLFVNHKWSCKQTQDLFEQKIKQ